MNIELLCDRFKIGGELRAAAVRARDRVGGVSYGAQESAKARVLEAFLVEGITEDELPGTFGYGYGDPARLRYEALLARLFGTESTLAQLSLVSGTHAIIAAIRACVPFGKTLLSITGPPYDTLRNALLDHKDALARNGVRYREVGLDDARCDLAGIANALEDESISAVFVQRSRGYAPRRSLSIAACEEAFAVVKERRPDAVILVDNCYGELVEEREPTHAGADLAIGSLIKNLGGTIAPAGAYVAGTAELIERIASQIYAPGLGNKLGPTLGFGRLLLQGLFMAPLVVEQTLRGLDFAAAFFTELGYSVDPQPGAKRCDIVQAIRLGTPERLRSFARGLQSAMPVNARFVPEPGSVPGYRDPVLMSSGAFILGSTLELSCDAPMREPYEVYLQGGAIAEHVALGALFAGRALSDRQERDRS